MAGELTTRALSRGMGLVAGSGAPPVVYDPDAVSLFARFATQPDDTRKQLISDRFVAGKAFPFWAKLDVLHVEGAHAADAARLNWLANTYTLTPINNPTFVVDRGYAGDGSSSYLETGFNPTTAVGAKFARDNAVLGIRSNDDISSASSLMGFFGSSGCAVLPKDASGNQRVLVNAGTASTAGASPTGRGMFASNRSDSASHSGYRDGNLVGSGAIASQAVSNSTVRLGSLTASNFRAGQFSMSWIGGSFTAQDHMDIFNWFEPYRTALGIV